MDKCLTWAPTHPPSMRYDRVLCSGQTSPETALYGEAGFPRGRHSTTAWQKNTVVPGAKRAELEVPGTDLYILTEAKSTSWE